MAKALVLDFGGVITRTLFETHQQSEAALGLIPGTLQWRGPFEPDSDALWRDMLAGAISERQYWLTRSRQVGALLGKNWTSMEQFVSAARSEAPMAIIRPEFLSTLAEAKADHVRLAILSNELDLFYGQDFRAKLPFMQDFDLIVDATYTNILKPDPRAYAAITDDLDLSAERCVFVDDQLRNVKGAQEFGMHAVHFDVSKPQTSYDEALSKLADIED